MARSFTDITHNLRSTSPAAVGSAGSIFLRLKPDWAHNDSVVHVFFQYGATTASSPSFQKFSDNNVYIGFHASGDHRIVVAASAAMFTNGTWTNHLFTWDDAADDEKYYADNVQVGSRTLALTATAASGLTIGNYNEGSIPGSQRDARGDLAEYGEWDHVLSVGERSILEITGSPLSLPRGLTKYFPIMGRYSPEVDLRTGVGLTVSGTAQDAHPRIFLPSLPTWRRWVVPVSGPVLIPPTTSLLLTTFAPVVSPDHQVVTPPAAALTTANFSPTVLVSGISEGLVIGSAISFVAEGKIGAPDTVVEGPVTATPTTAGLTLATFAPTVSTPVLVTPTTASLTLTAFAPTVSTPVVETPGTAALALTAFAPTAAAPILATPETAILSLTTFVPTAVVTVLVTPETLALSLGAFAPTVPVSDHQTATPSTASLALTAFAPSVTVPGAVVPGVVSLSTTSFAPAVITPSTATPSLIALTIAPFAPAIGLPNLVTPTVRALTASLFAPTVSTSANQFVTPEALALSLSGFAPSVGAPVLATPNVIALSLSTFTPSIATPRVATPQLVALALSAFVPTIIAHQLVTPTAALLLLSTFAVTIVVESEAEPLIITGTLDIDSVIAGVLGGVSVISDTLDADSVVSGTLGS